MKRYATILSAMLVAGSLFLSAQDAGEPAPELDPITWLNGDPVEIRDPDRIYIVELWATWCPHCVDAIGEVADVQNWFADYATVVAVTEEPAAEVRKFVDEHPELDYLVAVDPDGFKRYRERDGVPGIPHAFIISEGKIRWHGHPASNLHHQVYRTASEVDPTCRLVEAAARGDIGAVKAALARGADPNLEVVVAYGSQRGVLHARPVIDYPGFMVSGGEDDLTGFEAAVVNGQAEITRLLREAGGMGSEELMHRAAVLLGEAEAPPTDVRLQSIERLLSPEEYAPLIGEWICPRGLETDDVMAREVVGDDGKGVYYNHILDEEPASAYTFEVTGYDKDTNVYSVVMHFGEWQEMRCLVRVSGDRREWIFSMINSGEFPPKMDPNHKNYFISHPRGRVEEPLDPIVGGWVNDEADRQSRTVYDPDGNGAYFFHSSDTEPSNRFVYDIIWRNPETDVFYLFVFYREWQWFYFACRVSADGKRLESTNYGRAIYWFAPEPSVGGPFYAISRKQ